ncbi:RHD3/Sey1 [Thamnocephalis sphaerospora]|uniref:RHD3/Sey1 n=1 Tax=Thamnocephalis sphaerospora TaxID=78915 RepID=A0A4P9XGA7_9FUNG|nr:RHD3/Sey1 [Thamnocephalis sphaerospora]|eukprot:RKP04632.1 RHD3/Sey1 [Thamnocephalis sphaerospora]
MSGTNIIQLTDGLGQLTNIDQHISVNWKLKDCGLGYHVVAIFGSQSTGKSTLLNALFGTDFNTMDASSGRMQTTKGIWMGKSANANILVMDVEGVDGQERGEDKLVERRSALFSLAIAEVFVINVYEAIIGLYSGANTELFKTIFEANTRPAEEKKNCKTLLLFVIRDYAGQTPLEFHKSALCDNMAKIWDDIAKPEHLRNSLFSDFFDCTIVGLPPKPIMPDQFSKAVDGLRLRFTDPNHSDYVFKPRYHRGIPIDGFSRYASGIWDAVLADDMLSIPSQQMLLAEHRCTELRSEAEAAFKQSTSAINTLINDGKAVDGLGKLMEKARNEAIAMFDANAKHYHQDVYTEMRNKLCGTFDEELTAFFRIRLKIVAAQISDQFDAKIEPLSADTISEYIESANVIVLNALDDFDRTTNGMMQTCMLRCISSIRL